MGNLSMSFLTRFRQRIEQSNVFSFLFFLRFFFQLGQQLRREQ